MTTEIINLRPFERTALNFERNGRIVTALFVGLAILQFGFLILAVFSPEFVLDEDMLGGILGSSAEDLVRGASIGAALWTVVTVLLILAVNSGPRWISALSSFVLVMLWLGFVSAAIAISIETSRILTDAYTPGTWTASNLNSNIFGVAVVAAFGLSILAMLWISAEALIASTRGFWSAAFNSSEKVRMLRGIRGMGLFSLSGVLATFDLPLVLRDRGSLLARLVAIVGMFMATVGACFILAIPLNLLFMFATVLGNDCADGSPAVQQLKTVGACVIDATLPMTLSIISVTLIASLFCWIGAFAMATAKRMLSSRLAAVGDEKAIVVPRQHP